MVYAHTRTTLDSPASKTLPTPRGSKALAAILTLTMLLTPLLSACSVDPSRLSYLDKTVTVVGLTPDEFTLTIRDLVAMDAVSEYAEGGRSNGDIVKFTAVGPTLDTLLAQYGKTRADYTGVRFSSTDGFSVIIPTELYEKRDIVLAYMNGGASLDEFNAPLRAIVVGERAMYWAKMVNRVEFLTDEDVSLTNKLVLLDTILPAMGGTFSEEEGGDVVSTIDILSAYGGLGDGDKVYLTAYDGLKKSEMMENFLKGGIKYTGEKTPQFCSPELPEGMNMDGIVSIRTAGVTYYSLTRATESLPAKEFNGQTGLGFSDIMRSIGFVSADLFRFEGLDGTVKLVTAEQMSEGIFIQSGEAWQFIGPDDLTITNIAFVAAEDLTMQPTDPSKQAE